MSNLDEILDGERPTVAAGFLVQAANRRQVEFALKSLSRDQIVDVIRDHLTARFGAGLAAKIIDEMAAGLVFTKP